MARGICAISATSHMAISEVMHSWQVRRFFLLVHAKGVKCGRGQGSMQATWVLPLKPWLTMSSWTFYCEQDHCHAGTCLCLLVPDKGNCNATTYKDILYNYVLPTLWQVFRECPNMGVMARSPHMFGHIELELKVRTWLMVYLKDMRTSVGV